MADSRENIAIIDNQYRLIEVDPDSDGFTSMLVEQINTNHTSTYWSPINTTELPTSTLPKETVRFDYNIYVRNENATENTPVAFSITRL